MVSPAVTVPSVVERLMAVMASIPVRMERASSGYAEVAVVMRMREVPRPTSNYTMAIVVMRMVADGEHFVLRASLTESVCIVVTVDPDLLEVNRTNRHARSGHLLLDTECVHVGVVAISPPVCAPSVLERTSVMTACRKEGANDGGSRYTVLPTMGRVREMPPSEAAAYTFFSVVTVVVDRTHSLGLARLLDVVCVHHTMHLDSVELHSTPRKRHLVKRVFWFCAHSE